MLGLFAAFSTPQKNGFGFGNNGGGGGGFNSGGQTKITSFAGEGVRGVGVACLTYGDWRVGFQKQGNGNGFGNSNGGGMVRRSVFFYLWSAQLL